MKKDKKIITNKRRSFIKKAGLLTLGAAGATAIKAPYVYAASNPIKWRLQTYSGAPLGAHVIKPQIEACLLYTSPSPRDRSLSRMPSSA